MNETNPMTSALDLLEANHSEEEFSKMIARNKLLSECKAKGFGRMKRLGLIRTKKPTKRGRRFTDDEKREIAQRAHSLREKGLTYKSIQEKLGGIAEKSIRKWMKEMQDAKQLN